MESKVYPHFIKKHAYRLKGHKHDVPILTFRAGSFTDDYKSRDIEEFWFDVWQSVSDIELTVEKTKKELALVHILKPVFARNTEQDTQPDNFFVDVVVATQPQGTREEIASAKTEDDIVRITSQAGFDHIKIHIKHLHDMIEEDGDDYLVHLESLKNFVLFLVDHPNISPSQVGVTPDNFVDVIWDTPDRTITLLMEFLPCNQIRFNVMKCDDNTMNKPQFIGDEVSSETIMEHIRSICPQLVI